MGGDSEASQVCLVSLVDLVCFVVLVHLVSFVQPNNQTNEIDQMNKRGWGLVFGLRGHGLNHFSGQLFGDIL